MGANAVSCGFLGFLKCKSKFYSNNASHSRRGGGCPFVGNGLWSVCKLCRLGHIGGTPSVCPQLLIPFADIPPPLLPRPSPISALGPKVFEQMLRGKRGRREGGRRMPGRTLMRRAFAPALASVPPRHPFPLPFLHSFPPPPLICASLDPLWPRAQLCVSFLPLPKSFLVHRLPLVPSLQGEVVPAGQKSQLISSRQNKAEEITSFPPPPRPIYWNEWRGIDKGTLGNILGDYGGGQR